MKRFKPSDLKVGDYIAYIINEEQIDYGTIKKIEKEKFYLDNGTKVYPCQLYSVYVKEDADIDIWKKDVEMGYLIYLHEHQKFSNDIKNKLNELKDRSL